MFLVGGSVGAPSISLDFLFKRRAFEGERKSTVHATLSQNANMTPLQQDVNGALLHTPGARRVDVYAYRSEKIGSQATEVAVRPDAFGHADNAGRMRMGVGDRI